MKRGWIVLLAAAFVALGAIIWAERRVLAFFVMFAMEPTGWGCDEGPYSDWQYANSRGDVAAGYIRACTGIGTFVDHSIALKLQGEEKWTMLGEHGEPM